MPNPNTTSQDWYYVAPCKPVERATIEAPAPSQIPGLSNAVMMPDEAEERRYRRKWDRDTDSEYVKLAKHGRGFNLLGFKEPKTSCEAVPYPRSDWMDHIHPEEDMMGPPIEQVFHTSKRKQQRLEPHQVLPEWYVHDRSSDNLHEDQAAAETYPYKNKKYANIVSFDNKTAWQRQTIEENQLNRKPKLPPIAKRREKPKSIAKEAMPAVITKRRISKLPNINSEPVNMTYLLSNGYGHDWFEEQHKKELLETERRKADWQKQEEKRSYQMRNAAESRKPRAGITAPHEEKPLFKLSRFEHSQARVESFRT